MKFNCNKSDLIDAITMVQKAIKNNSTIQILNGILIQADNNSVKLTGYDLETGIEADLVSDVIETGAIVVDSRTFGEFIKKLPQEMTTISLDNNYQVTIESGQSVFKIKGSNADPYPKIPTIDNANKITINQKIIKNMINNTIFAVSKDDTRPVLTGCLLKSDGKEVTMVAIDGFRMAIRKEKVGIDFPEMNFIIPGKALSESAKIFDGEDENKEVNIYSSVNHLLFDVGNVRIVSRLIQGEYFNYSSFLKSNPSTIMTVDRVELLEAIERASLVINTDERRCPVNLKMTEDDSMEIKAVTEISNFNEVINVNIEGNLIDIDFMSKYVIDSLKHIEDDEIILKFNGSQGPCLIVPKEDDNYLYFILPTRK